MDNMNVNKNAQNNFQRELQGLGTICNLFVAI